MKKIWFLIISLFMLINVSSALAQSSQDEINDSSVQFEEWAKTLSEFVKDVRFNEKDVQNLISQWDDFNSFGEEQDTDEEEYIDFNSILNDSAYRSWAQSRGFDSDEWLKKTMRIMAMIMRTQIAASKSESQFDMTAQLAEIEKEYLAKDKAPEPQLKLLRETIAMIKADQDPPGLRSIGG